MNNRFNLEGKIAIITGSSKGIGEAIARAFAENGATVVISSRKQEACDELAKTFQADGLKAIAIACHVGNAEDRKALVEKTIAELGGVDILVNNAGTNPVFGPIEEATETVFDQIMNVNVKAPWDLANLCLPSMKSRGNGSIINISSVESELPENGLGIYSVSKAAVTMLTKSQAKEWGKLGVRVNAICPGLIKTKFSAALWKNEDILKQIQEESPIGRMGEADEISGLALLLASSAGSFITGSIMMADGGFLLS
jgi:NAD(P)-dependent dehydrogenase (short-subunit alcohol dehydrogenase family)